ncbi:MAG: LptE family protein [Pirellulaceae bacterium]
MSLVPINTSVVSRRILAAGAMLIPLLGGCAGYQLGTASMFPTEIRTVHVPVFQNDTFRRYLGEQLTEAVVKEIEATTPYKVVDAANADSILSGRIVSMHKRILAQDPNSNPRDVETPLLVVVQWTDRRGDALVQETSIPVNLFDLQVTGASHFVAEGGQSVSSSQLTAMQRISRQIVSQMNTPW